MNEPASLMTAPFDAAPYNFDDGDYQVPLSEAYGQIPLTDDQAELQLRAGYIRAMLEIYMGLTLTDNTQVITGASQAWS